jgi:hypothetical protein
LTLDGAVRMSRRFESVPADAIRDAARLLDSIRGSIPAKAKRLANLARIRTLNRFHSEFVALARLVNADWRDIVLANLSYDLVVASLGCSTVALATREGPVVARNMDWWPEDILARASWLIRTEDKGQLRFANAGWPGAVGVVTGLSGRGFALVLNAVTGRERRNLLGYPVLLHLRRVLDDARDFEDALGRLTRIRLTTPCLITLVGSRNEERVVVERSPTRFAVRRPEGNQPLVCTNDYRLLFRDAAVGDNELSRTACGRYNALCRFFAGGTVDRTVADDELLYALSDDNVMQGITAQHILMRPASKSVRMFVPTHLLIPTREAD